MATCSSSSLEQLKGLTLAWEERLGRIVMANSFSAIVTVAAINVACVAMARCLAIKASCSL